MAEAQTKKMTTDDARRAELMVKAKTERGLAEVRALAQGDNLDALLARSVLAQRGGRDSSYAPSGDPDGGSSEMANGGMARGRGNKMYQHNYATGGSVIDHLTKKK